MDEGLGDIERAHEVEVDVVWRSHLYPFDEVATVGRHIEVSGETVRLGVERHEGEVYARSALYQDGVHNVVLVYTSGKGREWTYKAVAKEVDVVLENVDILEYLFEDTIDLLFRDEVVDTCTATSYHMFLTALGQLAVVVAANELA